jgi:hypothetical protein
MTILIKDTQEGEHCDAITGEAYTRKLAAAERQTKQNQKFAIKCTQMTEEVFIVDATE